MNMVCSFALLWLVAVAPGNALRFHPSEDTVDLMADKDEAYLAQVYSKLWDGKDLDDAAVSMIHQQFRQESIQTSDNSSGKHLIFMGPFDAGTHLLRALLVHNFYNDWSKTCEERAFAKKENALKAHCGVWKHGMDDAHSFRNILKTKGHDPKDVNVLVMVRSPVSQLASWRNDAWEIQSCVNRSWSELKAPCEARIGWPKTGEEPNALIKFSSAMDVYNHYIRMYQKLKADTGLGAVALVTYEDVIMTPKKALMDIKETFGWHNGAAIDVDMMSASQKFQALGRAAAMKKLQTRSFMDEISPTELRTICKEFDKEAIGDLTEGKHSDKPRPYLQDCK